MVRLIGSENLAPGLITACVGARPKLLALVSLLDVHVVMSLEVESVMQSSLLGLKMILKGLDRLAPELITACVGARPKLLALVRSLDARVPIDPELTLVMQSALPLLKVRLAGSDRLAPLLMTACRGAGAEGLAFAKLMVSNVIIEKLVLIHRPLPLLKMSRLFFAEGMTTACNGPRLSLLALIRLVVVKILIGLTRRVMHRLLPLLKVIFVGRVSLAPLFPTACIGARPRPLALARLVVVNISIEPSLLSGTQRPLLSLNVFLKG